MSNPKYFNILVKPKLERVHFEIILDFLSRDHDMTQLDDPHLVELMRKGTIPPSLSLRAPPTHIGTFQNPNDVLGITKEEVSKRYIVKLRRERLRNNEAVYKSLDNLPIKIRQVAQNSFHKGTRSSSSSVKSKETIRSGGISDIITTQQYTKPLEPTWNKINNKNLRKQRPKAKVCWKSEDHLDDAKSKNEDDTHRTVFETSSFTVVQSEMPYIFSAGFQGHQNRIKYSKRKQPNVSFGQTLNSNEDFKRQYKRILDSNQQPHFVKSSFIKGQRVLNNHHKFKIVPYPEEDEHREELFAIKSVQKINEQFLFTSPASPTRVPNPSLYSECQNSDISINLNGQEISPQSRAASSTLADVDSRDNSFTDDFKENNDNFESKHVGEIQNETFNIPVLSQELLRVHEHETSAQSKKSKVMCNLTDITERDESNLTKTSRSEVGQDVRISVLINYKSKEDAIEENGSIRSVSSGRSKNSEAIRQLSKSSSFDSRRNTSSLSGKRSETQFLDTLRVEGHLFGEKTDLEKRKMEQDEPNINDLDKKIEEIDFEKKTSSLLDENVGQQIIVDLNRLRTVKTPIKKKKDFKENENESGIEPKPNSRTKDERSDFFLTYDEGDSAMSHYNDPSTPKFDKTDAKGVKGTPRTDIDDSGISISTFENEAIKC